MSIKLNMETQKNIRKLGRRTGKLQEVAVDTVNSEAQALDINYKRRLQRNQRLRARKFTLGSIKIFKATPIRRSGEPRQLGKINAIIGIRRMKGGKQHYLAKLEEGVTRRGHSKTRNRVPIPLTAARTSRNINKPISSPNRLTKGNTQTLKAGSKIFGLPNDRFKNPRQRFAILYRYFRTGGNGLTGDLKKPFFFVDNSNQLGIFKFISGRVRKIRNLKNTSIKTRKRPNFQDSVNTITPTRIQRTFNRKSQKKLAGMR